ncbi:MAG: hypothetical protein K2W96_04575 [Gemmataceae bacterium]|nr:hypothetical protein [Gemmataceae bacterium]
MRLTLLLAVLAIGCFARSSPDAETPVKKDAPETKDAAKKEGDKKDEKKNGEKKDGEKTPVKGFAAVEDINTEITALQVLYTLNCDAEQLEALGKLAASTMQEAPPRKEVKVTDKYRRALVALREALGRGDDEEVDKRFAALDELREAEEPAFDPVELTEAARKEAPGLFRRFNARQIATYLKGVDDFPDPVEKVLAALEESRKRRGAPWRDLRDGVAFEAGWLLAGADAKGAADTKQKVIDLLDKAAKMEDKEYDAQKPALAKEAKDLLGKQGPSDIIRNYMEYVLAETLSNHRLKAALERLEKGRK